MLSFNLYICDCLSVSFFPVMWFAIIPILMCEHIWRTIVRLSLLYYDYLFNVQWINPIFHGIYDMNNQQWQHHKKKLFTVTYHESIESWCDATIVSRSKLGRYKLWCFRIGKKINIKVLGTMYFKSLDQKKTNYVLNRFNFRWN